MRRKLWFSAFMAVLGVSLLVAAGFANAASTSSAAKRGGTMRMNMSATDVDFTDPSLAYGTISWQIEYATALKLVNYPDRHPPRVVVYSRKPLSACPSCRTTARPTRSRSRRA